MTTNNERERERPHSSRPSSGQSEERRPSRRPFRRRRKRCAFCADHSIKIEYKDAGQLKNYVTDRGKILPRRSTGTCARHQRRVTLAIKRARHLALLPFTVERYRGS